MSSDPDPQNFATTLQIERLFTLVNYCFSTVDIIAARTPTYYFALGGLAQLNRPTISGRIRTQHVHGAKIQIRNAGVRHFFCRDVSSARDLAHRIDALTTWGQVLNLVSGSYRTVPMDGDQHVEAAMQNGKVRRHRSGGAVRLRSPFQTDSDVSALIGAVRSGSHVLEIDGVIVAEQ